MMTATKNTVDEDVLSALVSKDVTQEKLIAAVKAKQEKTTSQEDDRTRLAVCMNHEKDQEGCALLGGFLRPMRIF